VIKFLPAPLPQRRCSCSECCLLARFRDREASRRLEQVVSELQASNIAALYDDGLLSDRARTGIERVIPQFVNFNWLPDLEEATNVTIAKLKLNFTENPSYYAALETILSKRGSVTLVMSDPRSPAMWLRYMEEPHLSPPSTPPTETTWARGLEDLAIVLYRLLIWRERLVQKGRDVSRLSLKVFPHYPTHAFYKFDDRLYVFHYPYLERGFHTPTLLFTDPTTPVYQFLDRCLHSVVNSSFPLEDEIDDIWQKYQAGSLSDERVSKSRVAVVSVED